MKNCDLWIDFVRNSVKPVPNFIIEENYRLLMNGNEEEKQLAKEFHTKLLDEFIWSYSRVNTFCICKRMFYYEYILKLKGNQNFFSQYGILNHEIFEKFNRGEIDYYDTLDYYEREFKEVISSPAPPSYIDLYNKYYEDGVNYWSNFDGFDDELLGAECKLKWELISSSGKKYNFIGFADRISILSDGSIRLMDYKSKGKWKSKAERYNYFRQLYLYSVGIKNMFGKFPKYLQFNQYRIDNLDEIIFDEVDFEKTISWVLDIIESIYNENEFACVNKKNYFCDNLCGYKEKCVLDDVDEI